MSHIKDRLSDYHDFMKKLADGHQITQFRNIHVTAPCSKNHSYFIKPGGRLSSQMRLTRPAQSFIIKMLYL